MLEEITHYKILGIPLIAYLGLLTLFCFLFTAYIAVMNKKGDIRISPKWHPIMARISISLAILHGLFGLAAYL